MADRTETVVLPAILKAATSGPKAVRLTAIKAIGGVGDASCVAALLTAAIDADADLALAAKTALAGLASDEVDAQIVAAFPTAKGKSYPLLIELVGQRRIEAAVPGLLKAVDNSDSGVRSAALTALGETVSLQRLPVLISQALTPKYPTDAAVAQKALKAASVRMPDREACAAELAKALTRAPAATKTSLLEIIGDVGGTTALRTLATAAKSKDPLLQDAGSRLLGKWNSVDAAPVLLDLAKTAPESKYQIRALRGYIGIVRKFAIPAPDRAAMCQAALDTASRTDEQKLVMDVLKLHPSAEGLAVSIKAMSIQAITPEATQASLAIAQKLGAKVDVNALAKAGFKQVKLEIVKAEYGAGAKQKDVTATIRKHAGNLPLITLPSTSYNTCFGGDPLPGSVKKLSIQYRINGKAATTTFPEDALIILTVPK
jgi:HEAT repeat protein